jgi:small-conductance mechanosensitive channel
VARIGVNPWPVVLTEAGRWVAETRRPAGESRPAESAHSRHIVSLHSPPAFRITPELITPLSVGAVITSMTLVIRYLVLKRVARSLVAPGAGISSLAWDARLASLLWCVALGAWGGLEAATLPPRLTAKLELFVQTLIIATVTITVGALLALALDRFAKARGFALAMTGLGRAMIRATILILGGLVMLAHVGVTITPMLTALGIGGLAAALALQDTLSNLLGGFHILIDRPVRVGDTVRLENGQEGEVEDIGWRSTRIRSGSDELIVVPNAKLAQSILTNRTAYGQSSRRIEPRRAERRG